MQFIKRFEIIPTKTDKYIFCYPVTRDDKDRINSKTIDLMIVENIGKGKFNLYTIDLTISNNIN